MAVTKITIREHTTSSIEIQLLSDNVAIDLTQLDGYPYVRLDMLDSLNKTYRYSSTDDTPSVVITNPSQGIITFTPPDEDVFQFQRSPYKIYVWVFETSTKKYSVPEKGNSEILVEKEY